MNFIEGVIELQPDGPCFTARGIAVGLAGYRFRGTAPAPGEAVVLGVRPERAAASVFEKEEQRCINASRISSSWGAELQAG